MYNPNAPLTFFRIKSLFNTFTAMAHYISMILIVCLLLSLLLIYSNAKGGSHRGGQSRSSSTSSRSSSTSARNSRGSSQQSRSNPRSAKSSSKSTVNSNNQPKQHKVYTLNLKNGKKYVGFTSNITKRLKQHFNGLGAKWTQKHKPISIQSIHNYISKKAAKLNETKIYYKLKKLYGKDNVRGAGNTKSF